MLTDCGRRVINFPRKSPKNSNFLLVILFKFNLELEFHKLMCDQPNGSYMDRRRNDQTTALTNTVNTAMLKEGPIEWRLCSTAEKPH